MPAGILTSITDIDDFVRGVTYFGTGGGGRPEDGRALLLACLENNLPIQWVDVGSLPDEAWGCMIFGMGSIAPGEPKDKAPFGLTTKTVARPMAEAVRKLSEYAGVNIEIVTAFELGGSNTPKVIDAGLRLGVLIPDGDFCGRAVPELSQTTASIAGIPATPIAICDDWGNSIIVQNAATLDAAEGIGKMISIVTKAPDLKATCAHAAYLMRGHQIKQLLVPGTFSRSLQVGRAIREARESGKDPVAAAAAAGGGKCIFRGEITSLDWVSEEGYMTGTVTIRGGGASDGSQMGIWFRNENHLASLDGKSLVMSPDLIHVVLAESGEPLTNTKLAPGLNVAVIAAPNCLYRTPEAIKALGPEHFGLNVEYTPFDL